MVNTKHDVTSYESCNCKREIYDGNALYDAFLRAKQGSDWKAQVQRFEMSYLLGLGDTQRKLKDGTYEFTPGREFILRERGKPRLITGEIIQDRIVNHAICDEVLTSTLRKYLIYDNGASLKGKGISFTRNRLETHLHRFYRSNGSNDGYILLVDFSKYYDNIRHEDLMNLYEKYIDDELVLKYMRKILNLARVDVSYMTDDEYACCMDKLFSSLEYMKINKQSLAGKKYMEKHINVGNQTAQDAGIAYSIPYDNYIKIVKSIRYYGRYMDDSYIIHEDKAYLKSLLPELVEVAKKYGITINTHKTRICKLSEMWRYLQIQYSLTDTGRVVHKINPKRLSTMRRKMKKIANRMTRDDFRNFYKAWFKNYKRYMSKQQRNNMDTLYNSLKEVNRDV